MHYSTHRLTASVA